MGRTGRSTIVGGPVTAGIEAKAGRSTQQRKGKHEWRESANPSTALGRDLARDQATRSHEPGTEATASRWTIQVSSTSSVSNSSWRVNGQQPGPARCQVFLVTDSERDGAEAWARIVESPPHRS
jgi:hypothetical protein